MTQPEYITCRELIGFLDEYVDGSMPSAQRAEVDRHLAVCPPCVAYLETYRQTIALGKAALRSTDEPAPDRVPQGLLDAVRAARNKT